MSDLHTNISNEITNNEEKPINISLTENGKNKILDDNNVDVDILPKVGGNSIIINICSCFNWSYSNSNKKS